MSYQPQRRLALSVVFVTLALSQGAFAGWWKKAKDTVKDGINDAAHSAQDVVDEIKGAQPQEIAESLKTVKVPQRWNAIVEELAASDPAKLGQTLNELDGASIKNALESVNNIGDVAKHMNPAKLAPALDELNDAARIASALESVSNVGDVAKQMKPAKLAPALDELKDATTIASALDSVNNIGDVAKQMKPAKLAPALDELNDATKVASVLESVNNIGEVAKQMNPTKLGHALNALKDAAKVAEALDAVSDIGHVAEVLSESNLGQAVKRLGDSANVARVFDALVSQPTRALAVLRAVTAGQIEGFLDNVKSEAFTSVLSNLTTGEIGELGKVLGSLSPAQLSKLPWESIVQIKLPWKALDPRNVPWERVDPSQVRWSDVIPARATREAGKWFDERVRVAEAAAADTRASVLKQVELIEGIPEGIQSKFEQGREFVEAHAHKLEQGVRTEIGRGVADLKKTPWYQEIQNRLIPFTHVTAYELNTDLVLTFNAQTGASHVDIEFLPGVTLTNQDFQTLMAGAMPMPNVDVVEVAATSAKIARLVHVSNEYERERHAMYTKHGAANTYFASKRFVDWASSETIANEGIKVVATLGYGTEDALLEIQHHLMAEQEDLYAWLKQRLDREYQSQLRTIVKGLLKCLITKRTPDELGLKLPALKFETCEVAYQYEIQIAGATELYDSIIGEVADSLGIDWAKFRDSLQDRLEKLRLCSPHVGFVVIWDTEVDDSAFVQTALHSYANRKHAGSPSDQFDLLQEVLQELVATDQLPQGLRDNLDQLLSHMHFNSGDVLRRKLQQRLEDATAFNPASLQLAVIKGTPVVDLRGTSVAHRLEGTLDRLALGNEGRAEIRRIEFNAGNWCFHVDATVKHKHMWRLDGVGAALSTAWKDATTDLKKWTGSKRRQISDCEKRVLRRMGAVDEDIRALPKHIGAATWQELKKATAESTRTVTESLEAVDALKENLDDAGAALADSDRGKLLWHFMEKPRFVEVAGGKAGPYSGEPIYFVNGILNTLEDAKKSSEDLADHFKRPIRLLYNPSIINVEGLPDAVPAATGTEGVGDDLAECVYDRAWVALITSYMDAGAATAPSGSDVAKVFFNKPSKDAVRLQKNPTTRQLTHLLYFAEKPISIISHSQGCIQVRNACYSLGLLGKDRAVESDIAWVACGSPLGESEVWPRPSRYRSLINGNDAVAKVIGFKGGTDGNLFPITDHFMPNYVHHLSPHDVFNAGEPPVAERSRSVPTVHTVCYGPTVAPGETINSSVAAGPGKFVARMPHLTALSGDFNGDGFSDVCFVEDDHSSSPRRYIEIHFNAGNKATAEAPLRFDTLFGNEPGRVLTGDFDGDGYSDLLLAQAPKTLPGNLREGGKLLCRRNNGLRGFDELLFLSGPVDSGSLLWLGDKIHAGDFNGDGLSDLLHFSSRDGQCCVQLNGGNGLLDRPTAPFQLTGGIPAKESVPLIGDFNGDGRDDLAFSTMHVRTCRSRRFRCNQTVNCFVPQNDIYLATSLSLGFKRQALTPQQVPGKCDLVGDWNGDGYSDAGELLPAGHARSVDRHVLRWALNNPESSHPSSLQLKFNQMNTGKLELRVFGGPETEVSPP
jgi:hypothetical protein